MISRFDGFITKLKPNEIFVFGSNLAGRHGRGAARYAKDNFGALYGQGIGRQGRCYAIPTKDQRIQTLPLERIKAYIEQFYIYAEEHPNLTFIVTAVGCGLAGYKPEEIAPLFRKAALKLKNVKLPNSFAILGDKNDNA